MTLSVNITGPSYKEANVSDLNELYVVNRFPNEAVFNAMTTLDAYNFAPPVTDANFILDGVICNSDNLVTGSAIVDIYEADAVDSTTIQRSILRFDVARLDTIYLTGLNIIINKGFWVNAKTDDNNINLTLIGHRREEPNTIGVPTE